VKPAERQEARRLRSEEGLAVRVIAGRLGVARSSVSVWIRDIELTASQHDRLREANPIYNQQLRGQGGRSASAREARVSAQQHGRVAARRRNPRHMQGCMLYWAEGSKHRNRVVFTNTDVEMHLTFRGFLRECYGVSDSQITFRVNCHLNNGLSLGEIERWWLDALALPHECRRTSTVNDPSKASRWRRNVLVYGTASICVHSTVIVQSIYGAIQEYGGFARPEWLD
jgi:transposase-like protein